MIIRRPKNAERLLCTLKFQTNIGILAPCISIKLLDSMNYLKLLEIVWIILKITYLDTFLRSHNRFVIINTLINIFHN